MKLKTFSLAAILSAVLVVPGVQAGDATLAIEQMAEIILKMENMPSADDRITLDDIANDVASTNNERIMATTIKNMDKKVRPADKAAIMKVWISPAASEIERAVAKAILRFEEKPSAEIEQLLTQFVE